MVCYGTDSALGSAPVWEHGEVGSGKIKRYFRVLYIMEMAGNPVSSSGPLDNIGIFVETSVRFAGDD